MSVQATTWVWENSKSSGTPRLVLLAIADAANREGQNSYQSAASLARMTGVSTRSVWRAIEALEDAGELRKSGIHGGHGTTVYELPMMAPNAHEEDPSCANLSRDNMARRDIQGKSGVPNRHSAVTPIGTGPQRPQKETPVMVRASQIKPDFTPTPQMLEWARRETPLVDAQFESRQFVDHHLAKGSLMKDWNRAWQTWMRNSQKWTAQKNPQAAGGFNPNDWMNK